jgi:hypothetical protein
MTTTSSSTTETKEEKAERLANSAPFDVHKWSDYPEVKEATDALYDQVKAKLPRKAREEVQKRNLRVLLIDLYAKYLTDPTMYVGIHMGKTSYQTKALPKRYKSLHISPVTPDLVRVLRDLDFIEFEKGHYGRTGGSSHVTRIRTSEKLINTVFEKHGLEPQMIERAPNTECIILRDYDDKKKKQIAVDYKDTPETREMREDLTAYNNLLRI